MEYYYFVIVVIIVLKILFWTFYFYVRAQRQRQAAAAPRFIIVGAHPVGRPRGHQYNDRSAIIDHAEPVSATGPPPYAEVIKEGGAYPLSQPPSYEHVMTTTTTENASMGGVAPSHSYISAPSGESIAASGYNPAANQMSQPGPLPADYSRSLGGAFVSPGSAVSPGQSFSSPQQ